MNKIDLIIDALESAYEDKAGWCDKVNEALYAAHELRKLKPVAFVYLSYGDKVFIDSPDKVLMAKNLKYELTRLYALDEVKHD